MYNRYVPNARGSYDRQRVGTPRAEVKPVAPAAPAPPVASPAKAPSQECQKAPPHSKPNAKGLPVFRLPDRLDTGDLLVLLILLLLLQENDEDPLTLIITLAAFFLFQ